MAANSNKKTEPTVAAKQAEETKQADEAKQATVAKPSTETAPLDKAAKRPAWLKGSFLAKAKSPAGFWRCGVKFNRETPTRILVVTDLDQVTGEPDCQPPYAYLTQDQAQRVFDEPQLVIEEE